MGQQARVKRNLYLSERAESEPDAHSAAEQAESEPDAHSAAQGPEQAPLIHAVLHATADYLTL